MGAVCKGETLEIDFTVTSNLSSLYITLWKDFADDFEITLIAPNGESTGTLLPNEKNKTASIGGTNVYFFNTTPVQYNEEQEIFFLLKPRLPSIQTPPAVSSGLWKIKIRGIEIVDGVFNIWLPTTEEVSRQTAFLIPSINTTLTLPSTSKKVITAGAYNSRINSIADFSGRGYTRNNVYIKPDLVAPGVGIITTKTGGGYDSFSGTSFAAPFVTGACSLIMEWGIVNNNDPFLYGQRLKSFLRKGARRETNVMYPNASWGYGFLCIKDTLDLLVKFGGN